MKKKSRKLVVLLIGIAAGIFLWSCSTDLSYKSQLAQLGTVPKVTVADEQQLGTVPKVTVADDQQLGTVPKVIVADEQQLGTVPKVEEVLTLYDLNPEFTRINYDSVAMMGLSDDFGSEYVDRITFLCDSPTYWLWPNGLLSGGENTKQIWTGPDGTMTLAYHANYNILDPNDNIRKPINEVALLHQPEYLVIALGINGISFMGEDEFKSVYKDLIIGIQEASPNTIIILQSILPITKDYQYWGDITNVIITEANSWILTIAEDMGCTYLDAFSVFFDDNGYVKADLYRDDGLHPNYNGLTLLLQYIRTHGYVVEE